MEQWIPTIVALVGSFISGYVGVRIGQAKLEVRMARVEQDIGTHDSGMRGQLHSQQSALLKLDGRVTALEDRMDEI